MLGVVAALPAEARCFAGVRLAPGGVCRVGEAWVHCAGPGEARAREAAEHLIDRGARAMVSWGTAGALAPALRPGDLILGDGVLTVGGPFAVEPFWHERLSRRLEGQIRYRTGKLLHSGRAVGPAHHKRALFEASGALAVDMESAGIAAVARERGTPFAIIRAVVDAQSRTLPRAALAALDASGGTRLGRMLPLLLQDPREVAALLRLALDVRAALAMLRKVARLAGPRLAFD